jgi:2'-5' RNA ligase
MAFLGIRVPIETGRLLKGIEVPGEKEGASEYHITLLCFEDNWPVSEIAKALEATYDVICKIKPFTVKVEDVFSFPAREDKPVPIVAKVKSDDLHDMRDELAKEFDKCGIDFSKIFKDFKPHITLAYAKESIDKFKIDPVIEFAVQEVVLWGGDNGDDRIFITFPLKGPEKQKHSLLLQKAEVFCKLASNPQEFLTPSFERRKTEH